MVDQTDDRVYNTKRQKKATKESTEEDVVVIESKSADELNIEKMNSRGVVDLCSPENYNCHRCRRSIAINIAINITIISSSSSNNNNKTSDCHFIPYDITIKRILMLILDVH